jgi:hypothetical protein
MHLSERAESDTVAKPRSDEAGAPVGVIEITPEMIEAGVSALWATGAVEHPCMADESVVRRVFIAMISACSSALKAK